ncbi:hypothetical protein MRX96_016215 [Rhipicephalus microplus]
MLSEGKATATGYAGGIWAHMNAFTSETYWPRSARLTMSCAWLVLCSSSSLACHPSRLDTSAPVVLAQWQRDAVGWCDMGRNLSFSLDWAMLNGLLTLSSDLTSSIKMLLPLVTNGHVTNCIDSKSKLYKEGAYWTGYSEAITGPELQFFDVVASWPGSVHDSRIFTNSRVMALYEQKAVLGVLLGDQGYACLPFLMTPLKNPQTRAEKRYNKSQIKTRNSVERTFGVWKRRVPRRPEPTTLAPPKTTRRASRRPQPTTSAPPPVLKTPRRSVATWARQEVPRYFVSDTTWKTQRHFRRDLPLDCVPWPFRGCTLADIEKAAGGAQLPTDAAVEFCATCRVTVHYQCYYKGALHVERTKAPAEGMATTRKASKPAPLSQRSDTDLAALCRQQMGEDPHFAALLSGLPPPATSKEPPMGGVATMDVDRL